MIGQSGTKRTRLVVQVAPSGNGIIRARNPFGMSSVNGGHLIVGHIFWSGVASDFWTVEIRDHDPFEDDSAFFIAGTSHTFDGAVRVAARFLAEDLEVLR
jgi:hypothetical protein